MSIINELVKNGFEKLEEKNWTCDGTTHRRFKYKTLEVEYYKWQDEYFLDIEDYPDDELITYTDLEQQEWFNKKHFRIEQGTNYEEAVKSFKQECDDFIEGYEELRKAVRSAERPDESAIQEQLNKEIEMAQKHVDKCINGQYLWRINKDWEAKELYEYTRNVIRQIEEIKQIDLSKVSNKELRNYMYYFKKYGYMEIKEDDFYIKHIEEIMDKCDKGKC